MGKKLLEFMNIISKNLFESEGSVGEYMTNEPYEEFFLQQNLSVDIGSFHKTPIISIILDATHINPIDSIESIKQQTYTAWEIIVTGSAFAYSDSRIHSFADTTLTQAVASAVGDYICFISANDILNENALSNIVKAINENKEADAFYTDEDTIQNNVHTAPHFKPDYSPDTLLSYNYIGKLFVVSSSLYNRCGKLKDFTPEAEYDYILRACDMAIQVVHLPNVLISGMAHKYTVKTSEGISSIDNILHKKGIKGYTVGGLWDGSFHTHYIFSNRYRCEIILYDAKDADKLREWLELVEDVTCNSGYHVTVASRGVTDTNLIRYENALINNSAASVMRFSADTSFASMCNKCAFSQNADVYIFMSCDVTPLDPDWIESLSEFAQRRDIGTVSPLILTPDERIVGAGNVIGIRGWWGVPYYLEQLKYTDSRMNEFINTIRNISLSNFDAFMVSNAAFSEVNGFDESFIGRATIAELCMRLMWKYRKNIYTPYVRLQGLPEDFQKPDDDDAQRAYDVLRQPLLYGDKYYSHVFDPSAFTPTVAAQPFQAAKLNPMLNPSA